MRQLNWIRFGKLLSVKITTKNKNDNDDSIELNFEYSNSKIMYYSANVESFLRAKLKAESLIGQDVDLFCYSELEYEPQLKLWSDIRKTNNELHKIDRVPKVWGWTGILTSILLSKKYIEVYIQNWGNYFLVKEHDKEKFLKVKEKAKTLIGKEVQLFHHELQFPKTDEFDRAFFYDIREMDRTKQTKKVQDNGFFRDMDIPYEGLTDDEKDAW